MARKVFITQVLKNGGDICGDQWKRVKKNRFGDIAWPMSKTVQRMRNKIAGRVMSGNGRFAGPADLPGRLKKP
jgi:hypothetical protein